MSSQIRNVSDTAFMAAAYRAMESKRPDALFHDPLAARLAGEHGMKIVGHLPGKAFLGGWTVVIRTSIIDRFIEAAIADGVATVLNLGAGLDTRPYRMDIPPAVRWIEVDYPEVIDLKESVLSSEEPRCPLERSRLDLADVAARRNCLEAIAASRRKILVLTEAVIPYLSEDTVASVAADLRSNESIRYWIADYFSPASYRYRRKSGMSEAMKAAPFRFEPDDYFGFFARAGWTPKEIRYLADEAERRHRPAPFPWTVRLLTHAMALVASPERRREMKRYAGFVLFERARPDARLLSTEASREMLYLGFADSG